MTGIQPGFQKIPTFSPAGTRWNPSRDPTSIFYGEAYALCKGGGGGVSYLYALQILSGIRSALVGLEAASVVQHIYSKSN
jgi:hypothetical protein